MFEEHLINVRSDLIWNIFAQQRTDEYLLINNFVIYIETWKSCQTLKPFEKLLKVHLISANCKFWGKLSV